MGVALCMLQFAQCPVDSANCLEDGTRHNICGPCKAGDAGSTMRLWSSVNPSFAMTNYHQPVPQSNIVEDTMFCSIGPTHHQYHLAFISSTFCWLSAVLASTIKKLMNNGGTLCAWQGIINHQKNGWKLDGSLVPHPLRMRLMDYSHH